MEFLFEYLMFLAQTATVVVALLIVMSSLARLGSRGQPNTNEGRLRIHKLNDRMRDLKYSLESSVIDSDLVKKARKQEAKEESNGILKPSYLKSLIEKNPDKKKYLLQDNGYFIVMIYVSGKEKKKLPGHIFGDYEEHDGIERKVEWVDRNVKLHPRILEI